MTKHKEPKICIRPARRDELSLLPEIERRAGRRFEQIAELVDAPPDLTPLGELEEAFDGGRVWVAAAGEDRLAGFAYAAVIDDFCHLEEIDVLPEFGRRGIGAAMVREILADARRKGLRGVTLTTYRDVPWNAPFYRRLGFEVLARGDLTPGLAAAVAAEAERGLDLRQRVVMVQRC